MLGQTATTFPWRSGVVSSYNHFQFDGGTLEISAKMPSGNGMWPGLWMLPGPGGTQGDNAEIDLFEGGYSMNGVSSNDVFSWHLHSSSGVVGGNVNTGVDLTGGFHRYGLKWVPGSSITWYLDGKQLAQVTSASATIPDEPMELILNVQVANSAASSWHSTYDGSTPTSTSMVVSEVKVTSL
jgi:beta-glucanase (GH16 family)